MKWRERYVVNQWRMGSTSESRFFSRRLPLALEEFSCCFALDHGFLCSGVFDRVMAIERVVLGPRVRERENPSLPAGTEECVFLFSSGLARGGMVGGMKG
ncbi:hypothetical protein AOLI_G00188970 [Acnodon oligacanthus]